MSPQSDSLSLASSSGVNNTNTACAFEKAAFNMSPMYGDDLPVALTASDHSNGCRSMDLRNSNSASRAARFLPCTTNTSRALVVGLISWSGRGLDSSSKPGGPTIKSLVTSLIMFQGIEARFPTLLSDSKILMRTISSTLSVRPFMTIGSALRYRDR